MTDPPAPLGLSQAPDDVLADRAADGDRRAFAELVRRYRRLLLNYATRVLGSSASSDDVVQEAFITAWEQLDALHDRAAVRSWLIRITTRKAIDHLRVRREHADLDDHDVAATEPGPTGAADASSLGAAVADLLARMPEAQRQAWVLRELGGCTYGEIAAELRIPVSTVRGLLSRARATLVSRLQEWR